MIRTALLASAFGLALTATPALAQYYQGPAEGPGYGPTEEVTVEGPRVHVDVSQRPGGLPERISMSVPVHYGDLNLRTFRGARILRHRVRMAAADMCLRLRDYYRDYADSDRDCAQSAARSALVKADYAIQRARHPYRYEAAYYNGY